MRVPAIAVCLLLITACGGDAPSSPAVTAKTWDVSTVAEQFLPAIQVVAPGDSVRWTFTVNPVDNLGHNVLFKPRVTGAPPDITQEVRSGTRTLAFTTRGTFNYVCDLHGGMTGQIIVQ